MAMVFPLQTCVIYMIQIFPQSRGRWDWDWSIQSRSSTPMRWKWKFKVKQVKAVPSPYIFKGNNSQKKMNVIFIDDDEDLNFLQDRMCARSKAISNYY